LLAKPRQEHHRGWEMPGEVREVALPEVEVVRVVLVLRIRRQRDRRLQQVQVVDVAVAVEEEQSRDPGVGRTFPQVVAVEEEQPGVGRRDQGVGHRDPGVGRSCPQVVVVETRDPAAGPSCRPCPSVVAAAVVVAGNYSSPACRRVQEARAGHR